MDEQTRDELLIRLDERTAELDKDIHNGLSDRLGKLEDEIAQARGAWIGRDQARSVILNLIMAIVAITSVVLLFVRAMGK